MPRGQGRWEREDKKKKTGKDIEGQEQKKERVTKDEEGNESFERYKEVPDQYWVVNKKVVIPVIGKRDSTRNETWVKIPEHSD